MAEERIGSYNTAADLFVSIPGYKDAERQIPVCKRKVEEAKVRFAVTREEYLRWVYTAVITSTFGCLDEKELAAALDSAKNERDKLSKKIEKEKARAEVLRNEITRTVGEVAALKEKRGRLGIFAGKTKKQIEEELAQKMDFIEKTEKAIPTVFGMQKKLKEKISVIPQLESALQALREPELSKIPLDTIWGKRISFALQSQRTFAVESYYAVGLRADGTVIIVHLDGQGYAQLDDTRKWRNIVAVASNKEDCVVGLRTDGTVVAAGDTDYAQLDVSKWNDIVAVVTGSNHIVGLKADGTVLATGRNDNGQCGVSAWHDIIAVAASDYHTVGLKANGTVVAVGSNEYGQCDVSKWHDIVTVITGWAYTIGLKTDGTVVATGYNEYGQCDVGGWRDVIAVATSDKHVAGLKTDGTVVIAGHDDELKCTTGTLCDIISIMGSGWHFTGLKADGTVAYICTYGEEKKKFEKFDFSDWHDMLLPPAEFIKTLH